MISHKEMFDFLLHSVPNIKSASGGRQLVTICPFKDICDDTKGHLYIGPFDGSDQPIRYNCFKCGSKGLVNSKFLQLLGVYSAEFGKEMDGFIKNAPKYLNNKTRSVQAFNIKNDYITDCKLSVDKLKYINRRLGSNLTFQDCVDLKIVLNLYDILGRNNINQLTRDPKAVEVLNNCFVGFLSADNNNINMRNLMEGQVPSYIDKKYVNYRLFNTESSCKYFMLPSAIDITSPEPIDVYIAEGAFDVLGIYLNVTNRKTYRTIYSSIGGKGYTNLIEYLICNLGLTNINLHICPDLDILQSDIHDIVQYFRPFNFNIFIHRNIYIDSNGKQEKDFGVPKDHIIDQCIQLQKRNEC